MSAFAILSVLRGEAVMLGDGGGPEAGGLQVRRGEAWDMEQGQCRLHLRSEN